MRDIKYLIIGAGITGLSFAQTVKNDYLIVEKEDTVGGLCRTHYVKDYVWDCAGHFFHFADSKLKDYFEKRLHAEQITKNIKNTKVYYMNQYIDYPFQKNIHQLEKEEFIECLYYLYFKKERNTYQDFQDMLYGKFGQAITDKFLKPYNEKLYACSLSELDKEAMGRFFPYADMDDIVKNMYKKDNDSYNNYFDYPKHGAQTFIDILRGDLEQSQIRLDSEVTGINVEKKQVTLNNGEEISYKYLINTMPFNRFYNLYSSKEANFLSANQVLVFNIGFDQKTEIRDIHWIYYPSKNYIFYRVGFYDNILSTDKGSIYVEIGFEDGEHLSEEDINCYYQKTIEDLKEVGIIDGQQVEAYEHLIMNPGYVHITAEGCRRVDEEFGMLAKSNVYSIGRYGGWTYCSMEDCVLQARTLATSILQEE